MKRELALSVSITIPMIAIFSEVAIETEEIELFVAEGLPETKSLVAASAVIEIILAREGDAFLVQEISAHGNFNERIPPSHWQFVRVPAEVWISAVSAYGIDTYELDSILEKAMDSIMPLLDSDIVELIIASLTELAGFSSEQLGEAQIYARKLQESYGTSLSEEEIMNILLSNAEQTFEEFSSSVEDEFLNIAKRITKRDVQYGLDREMKEVFSGRNRRFNIEKHFGQISGKIEREIENIDQESIFRELAKKRTSKVCSELGISSETDLK